MQRPRPGQVQRSKGPCFPGLLRKGILDGQPHIRGAQLGQLAPVHKFHQGVDDGFRMDQHLDLAAWHVKQICRFQDLQPLVEQAGAVDGDLSAHAPGGVPEGVRHGDPGQLGPGVGAEGPARGGEQQPLHPGGVLAPQALVQGGLLAIHRDDPAFPCRQGPLHQAVAANDALLIGQCHGLARLKGRQQRRQPCKAADPVHHHVPLGQGGQKAGGLRPGLHPGAQARQVRRLLRIRQPQPLGPEFQGLLPQKPGVRSGAQGQYFKFPGHGPHHLQNLAANGACAAQDDDPLLHNTGPSIVYIPNARAMQR